MMEYELDDIERAALKGKPSRCVECGGPLPYGGHVATPLCDACLEKPVPPFPKELPFNSPEAVRQAAETISSKPPLALCVECGEPLPKGGRPLGPFGTPVCARCAVATPNPPSGVGTAEDQEISVGAAAAEAEELLREENAAQAADLQRIGALYTELLGEVERLRAELATSRERHSADANDLDQIRVTVRDESLRAHQAEEQRDALAEALGRLRAFLEVFLCRNSTGQWRVALDVDPGTPVSGEAIEKADAALQKAGRL